MAYKFNPFTGNFDLVEGQSPFWLPPVPNRAALPSGDIDGAARTVLDEDTIFVYDNAADKWHNTRLSPTEFSAVANAQGVSITEDTTAGTPNISDYKLTLHAADSTNPGGVSTTAQTFAGAKTLSDSTDSTSKDTGALIVEGGVGIEKRLNVGTDISALGNAGIGILVPTEELHIRDASGTATLLIESGSGTEQVKLEVSSVTNSFVGTATTDPFTIRTDDIERIYLSADGKVGINNATTNAALHVENVAGTASQVKINGIYIGAQGANVGHIMSGGRFDGTNFIAISTSSSQLGFNSDGSLSIYTDSGLTPSASFGRSERIRVEETGEVTINPPTLFTDTTDSTNKDTGAVILQGGMGIEKNLNVGGAVVITGDLTINGTTTTVNSTTHEVTDPNILVNNGGNQATANSNVAGITVEMSDATNARIGYDSSLASKFKLGEVGSEIEISDVSSTQILQNKSLDGTAASGNNTITTDADQITYERADGSKKNIDAASDELEAATSDLDDAIGALDATPTEYTPTDATIVADHLSGIDTELGNKADRDLNNLTSPTAVNQHLLPNVTNTINAGSDSLRYSELHTQQASIKTTNVVSSVWGSNVPGIILDGSTTEATNAYGSGLIYDGDYNQGGLLLLTKDVTSGATKTASVFINTGYQTATGDTGDIQVYSGSSTNGDSGEIRLQSGTAANGTQGQIIFVTTADRVKLGNQPTGADDLAVATTKYVDDNTSFIPGDLDQVSFSVANNQATFANVTGVLFANGVTRSAEIEYSVVIDATADLYESGKIMAVQRGADWVLSQQTNGDISQILFDMTTSGQLQYKSANYAGFVSGVIKCRAITTSV